MNGELTWVAEVFEVTCSRCTATERVEAEDIVRAVREIREKGWEKKQPAAHWTWTCPACNEGGS